MKPSHANPGTILLIRERESPWPAGLEAQSGAGAGPEKPSGTGPAELAKPVEYYGAAFSDMHRELHDIYVSGDVVVVQLALQGTHDGALHLPFGMLPPTGKRMDAPCCDVFKLADGKLQRFDCYAEGSVILSQLGVLSNLGAVLEPLPA